MVSKTCCATWRNPDLQTAGMENELVNLQCQKGEEMSFQKNANLLALQ